MDPFVHGDTIPMITSGVYEFYSNVSKPHQLCYRFMKVNHQIRKTIHGLSHDMEARHEVDFVESFDVLWEGV